MKNKKKWWLITAVGLTSLLCVANIVLACAFHSSGANIFTAVSGWVSGIATIILGVIALVQNLNFKKQSDKYQENIDSYTKDINEKFLALQNNIYEIQSQMLEMANIKEIPFLRPFNDSCVYPSHNIDVKFQGADKLYITNKNGVQVSYALEKNKYKKPCKMCNRGNCDIRDIKIIKIETVQHWITGDQSIIIEKENIINSTIPIILKKNEYVQFNVSVPISQYDELPKATVLLDLEVENSLGKKYITKFKYVFERNLKNLFSGEHKQGTPEIVEKAVLID